MKKFFKKPLVKNILWVLAVCFFGIILLNLTFMFDALYQGAIRRIVMMFMPFNPESTMYRFPILMHGSFVVIIGIISRFIFKSKMRTLFKAIYMPVPVATVLVMLGMFLSNKPTISYTVGTVLCLITLYYFYRTKQPWIYYFAVIVTALTLVIYTISGGQI